MLTREAEGTSIFLLSPEHSYRISGDERIIRDENKGLSLCLCNQQPIKRVFVVVRKQVKHEDMGQFNGEQLNSIGGLLAADDRWQGRRQPELA